MSYVRWSSNGGTSDWYIYHNATAARGGDADKAPRDEQVLTVWGCADGTHGIDLTYPEVKELVDTDTTGAIKGVTLENRALLMDCLREFVSDMEREFP